MITKVEDMDTFIDDLVSFSDYVHEKEKQKQVAFVLLNAHQLKKHFSDEIHKTILIQTVKDFILSSIDVINLGFMSFDNMEEKAAFMALISKWKEEK